MRPNLLSRIVWTLASAILVASSAHVSASTASALACGDIHVVWAHGSGGQTNSFDFNRFYNLDLVPRLGSEAVVSAYELGDGSGFGGYDYPALGDLATLIDAEWWLPGNPYDNSVDIDTGPACDSASAACLLGAFKGSDHIQVHIYNPR